MSILSQLKKSNGSKMFTANQLSEFEKLNIPETVFDNPLFVNNIISLTKNYTFKEMIQIIKENDDIEDFMLKSKIFDNARAIIDTNLFKTLKAPRVLSGFYKCSSCGSDNVKTRTLQTRSGDESSTDINTCQQCGKVWREN